MSYKEIKAELLKNKGDLAAKLVKASEHLHREKGDNEAVYQNKILEDLKKMDNAITDSTTSGAAAEMIPSEVKLSTILDNSAKQKRYGFLNGLMAGNNGEMPSKNVSFQIEAEAGFARGTSEWSSGNQTPSESFNTYNTAEVNIQQVKLYNSVSITDELETFGVVSTLNRVTAQTQDVFLKTIADVVLNADSNSGATGNINSDDQLAATTFGTALDRRLIYNNSIRDNAIANTNTTDIGAIAGSDDIFDVAATLNFDGAPDDRIIIMDNASYYGYMKQDDFKDLSKNGKGSTISDGAMTNIAGMDLFVTDLMRLTEADGKLSGATPANNTKGQFAIVDKRCIQHGYKDFVATKIHESLEKGILFEARGFFGFDNISNKNDSRVLAALGINVG